MINIGIFERDALKKVFTINRINRIRPAKFLRFITLDSIRLSIINVPFHCTYYP